LSKALIMLVRLLGLAAIVLGVLLWTTNQKSYLDPHIAIGISVACLVFLMAVVAITKKAILAGLTGIALAALLPVLGFMQLPLLFHAMGLIQAMHIAIALSVIGIAERLYSAIQRAG
jgi:hypothetical protein